MSQPKDLNDVITYLEYVFRTHVAVKTVSHGYPDEQSLNGKAEYPQVFLEAEMQVSDGPAVGQERYSMAFQILDKPLRQGTQPGTRSELPLLHLTKQIADEVEERIRVEGELRHFTLGTGMSLTEQGDDLASGWRYEPSFIVVKKIDRNTNKDRFI